MQRGLELLDRFFDPVLREECPPQVVTNDEVIGGQLVELQERFLGFRPAFVGNELHGIIDAIVEALEDGDAVLRIYLAKLRIERRTSSAAGTAEVAECAQALERLGVERPLARGVVGRIVVANQLRQLGRHCGGTLVGDAVIRKKVRDLTGVAPYFVELRPGRFDVLEAALAVAQRSELAPAEVQQWHQALGVRRVTGPVGAGDQRPQVVPVERAHRAGQVRDGLRECQQSERGRKNVNKTRLTADLDCRRYRARLPENQRHARGAVVNQEGVPLLVVITQSLAVIGGDDHQSVVAVTGGPQAREEIADERVGVGHLAVVGSAQVARRIRLGRLVGCVGLVQMNPGEEWLCR